MIGAKLTMGPFDRPLGVQEAEHLRRFREGGIEHGLPTLHLTTATEERVTIIVPPDHPLHTRAAIRAAEDLF